MTEKSVQDVLIKLLRRKGCYVIKTHPGLGTPTGCPDIIFFKGTTYGVIECKASETSQFQALQKETLYGFKKWGAFTRVAFPENLGDICEELEVML